MNRHRRTEAKRARRRHRKATDRTNRRDTPLSTKQRTTRDLITEWLFMGRLPSQVRRSTRKREKTKETV